ncbi:DnaJ family domain-containing protein [Alteribacter natronophilus]|uniref:DnaJ family domain-containing protein n=1 Tax=Alteribacter natronophilus TaxID=2583810 RepID=UPI001FE4EFB2|nr:DnaJ family domain-containing protein [Alteribacter natronophilus]
MDYRDPIGDMLKNSQNDDEELKGKGKPLPKEYHSRDVFQQFQKVAREQGFLPEWLKLQKDIYARLCAGPDEAEVEEINLLIRKYNRTCPPQLQKGLVTVENAERRREKWES